MGRTALLALGLLLLAAACPPSVRPASAQAIAGQTSPANDRFVPDPPGVTVTEWAKGLNIPWSIVFLPDARALVSERRGRILLVDRTGQVSRDPYATFNVLARGEAGLMGLALDPGFPQRPYVYAMMSRRDGNREVSAIVRLRHDGDRGTVERTIFDGIPVGPVHEGGRIAFGPDRLLYVGTGDTARPNLAADRNSLGGKVLRITRDGEIPPDNPFPNSPVYSYGHRNIQGLAWHPASHALYVSEHGPSGEFGLHGRDELNRIMPGGNYGWPVGTCGLHREGLIDPLICWPEPAIAPSGITFQGDDLYVAALRGTALLRIQIGSDGTPGDVERWFVSAAQNGRYGRLRDVVVGPDRALYVLTNNWSGSGGDRVLRLTRR
ncbi:MAG TPA: PQQ-dependent sugar dehydrogenase [Alphaproteobacteria bacterium]|nr:PQQ-dependent sugar dehydrogenase [Alphaproteobacteria bacterium]